MNRIAWNILIVMAVLLAAIAWAIIVPQPDALAAVLFLAVFSAGVLCVFFSRWKIEALMFALSSIAALPVTLVWWHLWMNESWIGTPKILHLMLHTDGEASYDATMTEMFLILFAMFSGLYAGWLNSRRKKKTARQSPKPTIVHF